MSKKQLRLLSVIILVLLGAGAIIYVQYAPGQMFRVPILWIIWKSIMIAASILWALLKTVFFGFIHLVATNWVFDLFALGFVLLFVLQYLYNKK